MLRFFFVQNATIISRTALAFLVFRGGPWHKSLSVRKRFYGGFPHHFFTFVSQFLQGFFKTILLYLSSAVVFLGRFHLLCICLPLISGLLGRSSGQIHSLPERFCGRSPNSSLHLAPGSPNSSLVCLAVFSGFLGRFLAADLFSEKVLRRVPTLLYTCLPTLLYICFPIFSGLLAFTAGSAEGFSNICLESPGLVCLSGTNCCCFIKGAVVSETFFGGFAQMSSALVSQSSTYFSAG